MNRISLAIHAVITLTLHVAHHHIRKWNCTHSRHIARNETQLPQQIALAKKNCAGLAKFMSCHATFFMHIFLSSHGITVENRCTQKRRICDCRTLAFMTREFTFGAYNVRHRKCMNLLRSKRASRFAGNDATGQVESVHPSQHTGTAALTLMPYHLACPSLGFASTRTEWCSERFHFLMNGRRCVLDA